jgi:hypothetical protein
LIKASEKHRLGIKPISKYFSAGRNDVYEMLKGKIKIKNR